MYAHQKFTVTEETVQQIADMIRSGEYQPGDRLPSERQLAQQLRVGRTSVREAIHRLEAIGLIEARQGRGTFVKNPSDRAILTSFAPQVLTNQTTLNQLFDLREIIEVAAAARAAQYATPAQLDAMRHWAENVETCIARNDMGGMVVADVEFHRQIIIATANDLLVSLMDSIVDLLRDLRYASSSIPELFPEIIRGHRAILAAIRRRDSQAAGQAMQDHLTGIGSRVKEFWTKK